VPVIKFAGYPASQISGKPDIRQARYPASQIPSKPDIRQFQKPDTGYLAGYPAMAGYQISGQIFGRISGLMKKKKWLVSSY